jgi:hypothetical protein
MQYLPFRVPLLFMFCYSTKAPDSHYKHCVFLCGPHRVAVAMASRGSADQGAGVGTSTPTATPVAPVSPIAPAAAAASDVEVGQTEADVKSAEELAKLQQESEKNAQVEIPIPPKHPFRVIIRGATLRNVMPFGGSESNCSIEFTVGRLRKKSEKYEGKPIDL